MRSHHNSHTFFFALPTQCHHILFECSTSPFTNFFFIFKMGINLICVFISFPVIFHPFFCIFARVKFGQFLKSKTEHCNATCGGMAAYTYIIFEVCFFLFWAEWVHRLGNCFHVQESSRLRPDPIKIPIIWFM